MKLAISNICTEDLSHLIQQDVDGFESTYAKLSTMITATDKPIVSVQGLLYGSPITSIFDKQFVPHMKKVILDCSYMGITNLVFGSATQRNEASKNLQLAASIFKYLGDIASMNGVKLALEPIPPYMGSEYLTSVDEIVKLLDDVDSKGLSINFDINNVSAVDPTYTILDNINPRLISHVHISSSQGQPLYLEKNVDYELAIEKLKKIGYNGWVSIEMLKTSNTDISKSIEFVRGLL